MKKGGSRHSEPHKHGSEFKLPEVTEEQLQHIIRKLQENTNYALSKLVTTSQLETVEERLNGKISEAKFEITKWMTKCAIAIVTITIAIVGGIAAAVVLMLKH